MLYKIVSYPEFNKAVFSYQFQESNVKFSLFTSLKKNATLQSFDYPWCHPGLSRGLDIFGKRMAE